MTTAFVGSLVVALRTLNPTSVIRRGRTTRGAAFRAVKKRAGLKTGWPCNCFAAGTLVLMCDGALIPIEEVTEGDLVWSKDADSGELACQRVRAPFTTDGRKIVLVGLENGDGEIETIETTAEHPFFVEGRGWVEVQHLEFGDLIPSASGELRSLAVVEQTDRVERVYNFGVENFFSYFVGDEGAWVHNCFLKSIKEAKDVPFQIQDSIYHRQ